MESILSITCACGAGTIDLRFKDNTPREIVDRVFCPACPENGFAPGKSWPLPGDWYIHFDLEVAKMFMMVKLGIDPELVNPGFVVDGAYVTMANPPAPPEP